MGILSTQNLAIRYRGFVLIQQTNCSWLVRPERSPMSSLLPFRTKADSLEEVKAIIDLRLRKGKSLEDSGFMDQAA